MGYYELLLARKLSGGGGGGGGSSVDVEPLSITENGTYEAPEGTAYNPVEVNVGGSAAYADLMSVIADTYTGVWQNDDLTVIKHLGLGNINLSEIILPNVTTIQNNFLYQNTHVSRVSMPKLLEAPMTSFGYMSNNSMTVFVFQSLKTAGNQSFRNGKVQKFDMLGGSDGSIGSAVWIDCSNFDTLIIRANSVTSLGGINSFNNTKFASGGSGGTLYVPSALISSYQGASNWSTILGYTNNQIKSIESTHTDPTAPIDLTLYYADGTPIS